ncbi:ferric reductase-like transmembrane domain-containing protein [Caldalkalibacillus thermarum TA2.A1]|uniref:Ferric reductase-like transmembrane domain-containing protein n=1 Tax=Caldalkalibacillus thermarum (strain TA2.A1) TaxID=986075 RepID=A0A8X8IC91_CALTT|nr:ferric reductase-like transmembrane domain-containing protein [Caldalkalibacillus thermarum]QZT35051.1 ferric reductase-like transmembrane domain-containing protein [Caldalkalibacillus thermarum TA2.A1]
MIQGIKSKKVIFQRHLYVGIFSALLVYVSYQLYFTWGVVPALWPDWGMDHPFWRAWAHAAFVLLFLALILSPAAKLWSPMKRFISWRREFGIWFAVLAFGHGYAIWDRWAQWDVARLFGFEYIEEFGGYILFRPEVGIMNMMGLVIAPMIILLAVTSFDRAVKLLGVSSWKWLHSTLVNVIFYVIMLRGILYLFFFFQYSPPNWRVYPPIWFLYIFLGMAVFVVLLQAAAFVKTVLERRSRRQENAVFQVAAVIGVAIMLIMPMALMTGTVAYFDNRTIKEPPAMAEQTQPQQSYAQSYEMVIETGNQSIHLWARNIDNEPYFRQMIEVDGETVSEKIYRYSERALYVAQLDADMNLVWTKIENIEPEEMGILDVVIGPGAWAEQYGTGEHQIEGLQVTIYSVGEAIADEVFQIPEEAEPMPMRP